MGDVMGKYVEKVRADGILDPVARREADVEVVQTEQDIVEKVRGNALKAANTLDTLIETIDPDKLSGDQKIAAVRAVADAQGKSVDTLMKMTGRDARPQSDDFTAMLAGMAADGFLRLNVELEVGK
jgi:arginine deiminase